MEEEEEEEKRYWEGFEKIRDVEDEEFVRAVEERSAKIRSKSKTLVYWDINNLPLPDGYDLNSFKLNIRTALERVNYKGSISIVAYGDDSKISSNIQQQLLHADIEMKHVPGDHWWLNYEFIDEIPKKCKDANLLLITDDHDHDYDNDYTSRLFDQMNHFVYSVLLGVTKRPANDVFVYIAKHIWHWDELIGGLSPLSSERVSHWLQLSCEEWYAKFPDSDDLSSKQDVDCSLSLEMCPEMDKEEEKIYWEGFEKIRDVEDEELVRAVEERSAKIRSKRKTLVYWDINNLPLPDGYDLKSFKLNIRTALERVNYKGPISIVAYGNDSKISSNIQQQLHHADIEMKHVPGDHWWLNYEFIDEIPKKCKDANLLLITDDHGHDDDTDYTSRLFDQMNPFVYSVLLGVTKRPANDVFVYIAKHIWHWDELIGGLSPLPSERVSHWLQLSCEEWYAKFPDSDDLSSKQDVDCSLSLEMCPEMDKEEEKIYWEGFEKIRDVEDEELVRAVEERSAKIRSKSKTLVYWDINNLPLPDGYDLNSFKLNIRTALERVNYKGSISIVAYGDDSKISSNIQQQLHHADIDMKHVPGDHWWLNYEFIDEIPKKCKDANLLLITDDHDHDDDNDYTSRLFDQMNPFVYSVLLGVTKRPANDVFVYIAKHIWHWDELIGGRSPLSSEFVSHWLQLSCEEWYAKFPDSDDLSSEQDVDCSLSLEMCPEMDKEEEKIYWEGFEKIRDVEDEELVRAVEERSAKIRSKRKTLVYWDINNLPLPDGYDLKSFKLNIGTALERVNYKGPISIVAYGNDSKISSNIQQQLHHADIEMKHVPGDHWWLNYEFIDEIPKKCKDANLMLITDDHGHDDDTDYTSRLFDQMNPFVYSVLLGVTKRPANDVFVYIAKHIWHWDELIGGRSPLSSEFVSHWLQLSCSEWYAKFPDSDDLSSKQDVDCSLSLEMCPEEIGALEGLLKIRALDVESAKIRSVSKTLVYWDIENFPLPEGYDVKSFSLNIRTALERVNYRGPISIVAYGDVSKIHSNIQQQLLHAEIEMKHVPGDPWWHSFELMSEIIKNRPSEANLLLITHYEHLSSLVNQLIPPFYSILLAVLKRPADTAIFFVAEHIWLWTKLIVGGSPLSSDSVSDWTRMICIKFSF